MDADFGGGGERSARAAASEQLAGAVHLMAPREREGPAAAGVVTIALTDDDPDFKPNFHDTLADITHCTPPFPSPFPLPLYPGGRGK